MILNSSGFLTTGDGVIPANVGLKDQQFALKWVQKHIHSFGGNASQITIAGARAGASSVSFQMLNGENEGKNYRIIYKTTYFKNFHLNIRIVYENDKSSVECDLFLYQTNLQKNEK